MPLVVGAIAEEVDSRPLSKLGSHRIVGLAAAALFR